MGKFGLNPGKYMNWDQPQDFRYKEKYQTEYIKRAISTNIQPKEKFSTAPCTPKEKAVINNCYICSVGKIQTTQNDYIKRHLYIKSCVDNEQSVWKFQPQQKVSIRNYTPKAINQEMNMGMWI